MRYAYFIFSKIKNDGYESEINSTLPFVNEGLRNR